MECISEEESNHLLIVVATRNAQKIAEAICAIHGVVQMVRTILINQSPYTTIRVESDDANSAKTTQELEVKVELDDMLSESYQGMPSDLLIDDQTLPVDAQCGTRTLSKRKRKPPTRFSPNVEGAEHDSTDEECKETSIISDRSCTDEDDSTEELQESMVYKQCPYCSDTFLKQFRLDQHFRKKHLDVHPITPKEKATIGAQRAARLKARQCPHCPYIGRFRSDVVRHQKSAHERPPRYTCDIENCTYHTQIRREISDHMTRIHPDRCEKLKCDQCGFTTIKKTNMTQHLKTHLAPSDKPYKCKICDYSSANREGLIIHMNGSHKGAKPYLCDTCGASFTGISLLSKHKLMKHKPKHLQCPHCDYTTALQTWLKNHMKKHSDVTPFSCQFCSYECKTANRLRVHTRIHTGERPYKCHLCDYSAMEGAPLKKHLNNIHHMSVTRIDVRQGKLFLENGEVIENGLGTTTNPIHQ